MVQHRSDKDSLFVIPALLPVGVPHSLTNLLLKQEVKMSYVQS